MIGERPHRIGAGRAEEGRLSAIASDCDNRLIVANPAARAVHTPSDIVSIALSYELAAGGGPHLRNPFFEAIAAIRVEGSIAAAARSLGYSYRHLWGYLKEQETRLGRALLVWEKGKPARLTEFAEKLLWAETRIRARLAPQIENLATEIGRELTVAFNDRVPIVTCCASHDLALPRLKQICETDCGLLVDLRFEGSLVALAALRAGRYDFAGIHLPLSRPKLATRGSSLHRAFGPLLRPGREKLIRVSRRTQGLFVARGNPLRIRGVEDLQRVRFVNRPAGTGTRALLEELLAGAGVSPDSIAGYDREEETHLAVAATVASGVADAGVGIQAAAAAHGADFVPLVVEDYFLVCEKATLETPQAGLLIDALSSPAWRSALAQLPGYDARGSGEITSLRRTLPWYA
jgi:putative molybdopterin biosynthesis protein